MIKGFSSSWLQLFAICSGNKTIKLWDKNSGGLLRTLTGHGEDVRAVAFGSTYLFANSSYDMTVKIWNTGYSLRTLYKHDYIVFLLAFDSNNLLAIEYAKKTFKLSNVTENKS